MQSKLFHYRKESTLSEQGIPKPSLSNAREHRPIAEIILTSGRSLQTTDTEGIEAIKLLLTGQTRTPSVTLELVYTPVATATISAASIAAILEKPTS